MSQEQLDYIVLNSQWNEEKKEWTVPSFTYKEKNMGLPKLSSKAVRKDSEEYYEKEKKEVVFKQTSSKEI